jgi:hypothetical protein
MLKPGSSWRGAALIASAEGNVSGMESAYTELEKVGKADQTLLQQMLVAAIGGRHSDAAASLLNLGATLDVDVEWSVFREPSAAIYRLLFPLNLFGIQSNPKFLDNLLDESVRVGGWKPPHDPRSEPDGVEIAKFLVELGAKPVSRGTEVWGNNGTVNDAARSQPVEFMDALLKSGVALKDTGALHSAVLHGRLDMVNFLLDNGADVNELFQWDMLGDVREPGPIYGRPLNWAVAYGHVDIVKVLLQRGADQGMKSSQEGFKTSTDLSVFDIGPARAQPDATAEIHRLLQAAFSEKL